MDANEMMRPFAEMVASYHSMAKEVTEIKKEITVIRSALDVELNKSQLADLFNISRTTLYKRIDAGEIPYPITLNTAIKLKKDAQPG